MVYAAHHYRPWYIIYPIWAIHPPTWGYVYLRSHLFVRILADIHCAYHMGGVGYWDDCPGTR